MVRREFDVQIKCSTFVSLVKQRWEREAVGLVLTTLEIESSVTLLAKTCCLDLPHFVLEVFDLETVQRCHTATQPYSKWLF